MKGTRPLDNNEIRLVSACFDGTFEARNRGLFAYRRTHEPHSYHNLRADIQSLFYWTTPIAKRCENQCEYPRTDSEL